MKLVLFISISMLISCKSIQLGGTRTSIDNSFVTTWRVGDPSYGDGDLSLTFPTSNFEAYNYDYVIDWGDGTEPESSQSTTELTHTYSAAGDYKVKVTGQFEAMTTYLKDDKDKLIEVNQIGEVGWKKLWYAFYDADNLVSYQGKVPSDVTNIAYILAMCDKLVTVDFTGSDTSSVTDMTGLVGQSPMVENLDLSSFDTSNVVSMASMFREMSSLSNLNISSFNTSKVEDMSQMFRGPTSLSSLNLSHFSTSKVTTMYAMFYQNNTVSNLDLRSFDTSNLENMRSMFNGTAFTTLDISSFNTSKVTNMKGLFFEASGLTSIDLSHFDTAALEIATTLFYDASSFEYINLDNWNLDAITEADQPLVGTDPNLDVQCDQLSGEIFGKTCI